MTVNEELKDKAIKEYIEECKRKTYKSVNDNVKKASLGTAALYVIIFALLAYKDYFRGRFEDGVETFGIGIIVSLIFVLPSCLFTWIMLRRRAARDILNTEEELRKTTYVIEDDSLVKRVEGDGRRTKRYKLDQITNASKDGYIVTFEYGNAEVELLDFYDPPLFERL